MLSSHDIEKFRAVLQELANKPTPQPDMFGTCGIMRKLFPELCTLRRNGYSLKMLIRLAEENGVRITPTALSGYMKKLAIIHLTTPRFKGTI